MVDAAAINDSSEHIVLIEGLQWRKVLKATPLRPLYFDRPETLKRLERVRNGFSLLYLIEKINK